MTANSTEPTPEPLRLRVLGTRIDVHFEEGVTPAQAAMMRGAWSRCLETRGGATPGLRAAPRSLGAAGVYSARVASERGVQPVAAGSFGQFAADLTSVVTVAAIEARAGELMMLHASALADPASGRAVALVGRSGMGKTTATRVLGGRFSYVTDETVAIDREGLIAPYPKPLSIIETEPPAPKSQVGPDELGLRAAPAQARLAAVVLLDRDPEAPRPRVVTLGHADAIVALAPHTSALAQTARPLAWLCTLLDTCGGAVRVTYREAHELPQLVEGLFERRPVEPRWAPAGLDGSETAGDDGVPRGALLHRGRVVDAVEIIDAEGPGTELLVMAGTSVVRLSGVAPAIWRALATPASLAQLASRIGPETSLPADYEARLLGAVTELERHALLRWAEIGH
ncbi:hypothetical protein [Sinomonas sp. P47F7]|uniref:hypothetical protein n=1 Tax=Sinomonas sp. P47F7 TaxID=3410987 RepID=UPI003BF5FDD7